MVESLKQLQRIAQQQFPRTHTPGLQVECKESGRAPSCGGPASDSQKRLGAEKHAWQIKTYPLPPSAAFS